MLLAQCGLFLAGQEMARARGIHPARAFEVDAATICAVDVRGNRKPVAVGERCVAGREALVDCGTTARPDAGERATRGDPLEPACRSADGDRTCRSDGRID